MSSDKGSSSGSKDPRSYIPSELRLSQKWDSAIERFATSATVGTALCGLASLVLFRAPTLRLCFTTFGAGFGAGEAYRWSTSEFEKEKKSAK